MMIKGLLAILFSTSIVAAETPFIGLEVDEMAVKGNTVHLHGMVKWEHPLGTLKAKRALVMLDNGAWDKRPLDVMLEEGVAIRLANGGQVECAHATLDLPNWLAVMHGTLEDKVIYQNEAEEIGLESERAELHFVESKLAHPVNLSKIRAEGSVEIEFKKENRFFGDVALFSEISPAGKLTQAVLMSNDDRKPCQWIYGSQGKVLAQEILLNIPEKKVVFSKPRGTSTLGETGSIRKMHFTAEALTAWAEAGKFYLSPPVVIEEPGLGTLISDGDVEMEHGVKEGKRQLRSIRCKGPSTFIVKDPDKGLEHRIEVFGEMRVDQPALKMVMDSPRDAQNKVFEDKQVHFSDALGEIFADKITLTYLFQEGKLKPVKLFLEGNIRLINHPTASEQYALADRAIFTFDSNELLLKGMGGKRVLLYDQLNKVQASAPGLIIKRDQATGKESLQGIGDVRFIFAEEEFNELKKRFSLHE